MKTLLIISIALLPVIGCNNSNVPVTKETNTILTKTPFSPAVPTAESFSEAKAQGLDLKKIDSTYISGFNVDTNKAAFKGHIHAFITAYRQMIMDVGQQLQANPVFKTKNFKFFNRIYFQANGTVDYYFYNFESGGLTAEEEGIFKKTLNEFIKTYKFPMSASTPFAQCCPVIIEARATKQPVILLIFNI